MKKTKLRNLSIGGLVLMFLLGVVLAFTGIFGGVFNTSTTASAETNSETSENSEVMPLAGVEYELDGSNPTAAAATWSEAVQYSIDNGVQVTVKLTNNWTAQPTGDETVTSFGEGTGFRSGYLNLDGAVDIVLDLNGKTLDRGLANEANAVTAGLVIRVGGTTAKLEIKDSGTGGTITGGYTSGNGGGIFIYAGTVVVSGGTISGNKSSGCGGGVYVEARSTAVLTINGGTITLNNAASGGGVFSNGILTMNNGTVTKNTATNDGGGIKANGGRTFTMNGGTIFNNTATNGGGVHVHNNANFFMNGGTIGGDTEEEGNKANVGGGILVNMGSLTISGGKISNNKANSTNGGGIWCYKTTFTMDGGEISKNTAKTNGGGIYIYGGSTFTMENGTISANATNTTTNSALGNGGGGIYATGSTITINGGTIGGDTEEKGNNSKGNGGGIYAVSNSKVTVNGGTFSYNKAATGWGGGINVYNGEFTMTEATVTYNYSGGSTACGGGIYVYGTKTTISGSEISYNKAKNVGAGISIVTSPDANVSNVVISHNESETQTAGGLFVFGTNTILTDAEITENTAKTNGGGVLVSEYSILTVIGGTISGNESTTANGGGVCVNGSSTFIMNDGTISGNSATDGGGVYAGIDTKMTIYGGQISANKANRGGGIFSDGVITINDGVIGGDTYATLNDDGKIVSGEGNYSVGVGGGITINTGGTLTINGGRISHNESNAQFAGGGIHSNGIIYMNGGVVEYNRAKLGNATQGGGGGGVLISQATAEMYMTGGEISYNEAGWGAGLYVYTNAYFEMSGGKITHNKSEKPEAYTGKENASGGGILMWGGNPRVLIAGGEISYNTTQHTGGGINIWYGSVTMTGGIIANNSSDYQGGAIHQGKNTIFTMTGGEISGNKAYQWGSAMSMEAGSVTNLSGGIITNNRITRTVNLYGAIDGWAGCTLNLSGSIQIVDNYSGASTLVRADIGLDDSIFNVTGKFTTAYIGLNSTYPATTLLSTDYGKYNGTTAPSTYFYSDSAAKIVELKDGEVVLSAGTTTINSVTLTWKYRLSNTDPWTVATENTMYRVYDGKEIVAVCAFNGDDQVPTSSAKYISSEGKTLSRVRDVGTYQFIVYSSANTVYKNASLTLNITPKEVSVSWSETQLYYSGSMQYPAATLSGVIGNDDCSLILDTSKAGTNAGNSYTVGVKGLSGAMAYNYKLASGNLSKSYSILPRELGVGGLTANDKVYDGTTAATLNSDTITLFGIVNDDAVTLTLPALGELNFDGANAGLHFVEFDYSDLKLSGAAAKNYKLPTGTLKVYAYISPATVKINGITLSGTKTYDGTYTATLNVANAKLYAYVDGAYSATALDISGLDLVISAAGSFTDVNAGTGKTVNITSLSLSGADSVNFIIATADSQATIENLTIAQAKVTVTVTAPANWTYGDAKQISYTVSGAVSGETVGVTLTYKKGTDELAGAPTDAGDYSVTAALTNASGNYVIDAANSTLTVNYTIGAKAITLTAKDVTAQYGATPAGAGYDITSGALLSGDTLDGTAAYKFGTVSGETFTEATAFAVGGTYKVQLSGLSNDNYEITFAYGTLSITKKTITVTLTPDAAAEYGKTYTAPDALVTYAFGTGDVLAADSANVTVKLTYYKGSEQLSAAPTNAGNYRVVATLQGTAAGNYKIDETVANFAIAKRALTITANDASIEYGDELPTDVGVTYGDGELLAADLEGDNVTPKAGVLTYKNGTAPVYNYDYTRYGNIGSGTFEITVSGITSANYEITFVAGELTVTAKDVTVRIENQQGVYGDEIALNSALGTGYKFIKDTAAVTSGVLARDTDDLGVVITTDATKESGVGDNYSLIAEWGNKNYNVTFEGVGTANTATVADGKTTIAKAYKVTPAALEIKVNDGSVPKGQTIAVADFSVTDLTVKGLKNTDTAAGVLDGKLTFSVATNADGSYKVTVAVADLDNYTHTEKEGTWIVSTVLVTVVISDGTTVYGEEVLTIEAFTATVTDSYDKELSLDDIGYELKFDLADGATVKNAGTYTVTAVAKSGSTVTGYKVVVVNGVYTITAKEITVKAKNQTITFGDDPANLYASIDENTTAADLAKYIELASGSTLVTGDNFKALGVPSLTVGGYVINGNAATYTGALVLSGFTGGSGNYKITLQNGDLTVNKRSVKVLVDDSTLTSEYGEDVNIAFKTYLTKTNVTAGLAEDGEVAGYGLKLKLTLGAPTATLADGVVVGTYVLAVDGTYSSNYEISNLATVLAKTYEITAKAITVTANDVTCGYDETPAGNGYKVEGLVGSDTLTESATFAYKFYDASDVEITTGFKANGAYTVKVEGLENDNYTITYAAGTLTVNGVKVTVTVTVQTNLTYGYTGDIATAAFTGVASGDDVTAKFTYYKNGTELSAAPTDAGDYTVVVSLDGADKDNYTLADNVKSFSIARKAVTVKAKDQTITYGDDPADLYDGVDLTTAIELKDCTLVTGDTLADLGTPVLTVSGYSKYGNVATYTGAIVLGGLSNANYDITFANGDLEVTALEVDVVVDDSSLTSVYGENVNITYNTYLKDTTDDGEVAGHALGLKLTLGAPTTTLADGVVVGTYAIVVDGTYSSNYEISNIDDVLAKTYEITAKAITVTANDVTCGYDETPEGNGYKVEGLVGSDTLTEGTNFAYKFYNASGVAITTGFKANGTYTVKVEGLENDNYAITYEAGTLNVNGVKVTATVTVQANLTYGYTGDIATATLTGVASGDTVTAKLTYYDKDGGELSEAPVNAGTYSVVVTLDGADKDNYTIEENSKSFTIAKKAITVKAAAQTLVYGDDPAKIYDGADYTSDTELAKYIALDGCTLAGTDDLTVLGTPSLIVSGYSRYGNVATYSGAIVLSGLSNANYDITFANGDLTVTAREVKIVLTTEDQKTLSSVYGKAFGAISYTVYDKDNTTKWTSGAALGAVIDVTDYSTQAGTYDITVNTDNLNANYTLNQDSIDAVEAYKYTIAKAEITVKPNDIYVTAGTEVSGDATNITLTKGTLHDSLYDIFAEDGSLTFTFEGYNAADKKTGTFAIAITVDNTKITNYTVTVATDSESNPVKAKLYVSGASTIFLSIDDASVLSSVYGNALKTSPQLVAKVKTSSPDVKVADLDLVLEIVAEDGGEVKNVGNYKVQIKSHKADLDYTLVMTETPYKITARPITLKVVNAQLTYGDAASDLYKDVDFTDTALNLTSYIGLASGSTLAAGDTFNVATFGTPTFKLSGYKQYDNIGTYEQAIVINGLSNDNYAITYQYGSLKVNARSVKVTLDDTTLTGVYGDKVEIAYKVFLDSTPTTATPDGLVNGDDLGLNISLVSPVYTDSGNLAKGSYNITAGTEHNGNYEFSWVTALSSKHYVVTAKSVTITADDATVTYGEPLYTGATYGYKTEGFVDGEDETVFTGSLVFKAGSVTLTNGTLLNASATAYTVTPSGFGASQGNYNITYVAGSLTVTPKKVAVTVKTDGEKTYDGAKITLPADYYDYDDTLLVDGDDLGITLEVQSNAADCGMYLVTVKTASNTNYEVVATAGYYKITEQKVYVQWLGENGSATDFSWTYNVSPTSEATKQGPTAKFYKDAAFTQELTFVDSEGETIEVTVNGLQINVGDGYVASVQLPDSVNYVFASGTVHTKEFSITEAQLTVEWKKSSGSAVVADGVAIEYTYSGSAFAPVPVLKLGGVDVTENVAYTLSGKSQDVGAHTVTLEVGLNYVIMVDGEPTHSAQRAFTIVGTALKNFNWQLPSGVFINADDVKNGVEQSFEYTGAALSPKASAAGATISYTYMYSEDGASFAGCGDPINAGHYKVTAVVDEGYAIPAGYDVVYFEITKVKVDIVWTSTTFTFADGTHQAPTATFKDKLNGNDVVELLVEYSQNGIVITDSAAVAEGNHEGTINVGEYYATIKPLSESGYDNYEFRVARDVERKYKINADTISIQWGPLYDEEGNTVHATNGTYTLTYSETAQGLSWGATKDGYGTQNEQDNLYFVYTVEKDGTTYELTDMSEPDDIIKDAGTYKVGLALKSKSSSVLVSNYALDGAETTVIVKPAKLKITLKVDTASAQGVTSVNYGDAVTYRAEYEGLVNGDDEESLGLKVDGNYWWIASAYTTSANPGSVWKVELTKNTLTQSSFYDKLRNYEVEIVGATFTVSNVDGFVSIIGWNSNVSYFIYDGEAHEPMATYWDATQGKAVSLNLEVTDGPAVLPGTYHVKVEKPDGVNFSNGTGADGDIFEFTVVKRVLEVEVASQTTDYGTVSSDNAESCVAWHYGVYEGYNVKLEPVDGDAEGLNITVGCTFNFDSNNYAIAVDGGYTIDCSWNSKDFSDRYQVIFVDENNNEITSSNPVKFIINKAKIIVTSRGEAFFDEELALNPQGVAVGLGALNEDGTYKNIIFGGSSDTLGAKISYEYRVYDLNDEHDAADLENENYKPSYTQSTIKINKAGSFAVRYKIEKPNHETLEGVWRVLVLKEDDAIIVLFQNRFSVEYGTGVPADFIDKIFGVNADGEEYFTVKGAVTDKDIFRDMVERAYVYNVNESSKVGYYTIYFDLKEGISTSTQNFEVVYREIGGDVETNHNMFVITQKVLTVDWGMTTDTFTYDEKAHMPAPVLTGWLNGGICSLSSLADGQRYFYTDNNNERITISVALTGDFTSIGEHEVKLVIDNLNYTLDENYREVKILGGSILPENPTQPGLGLPAWATWALIAAAVLLMLVVVVLIVALKKRKQPVAADGDEEGFYETAGDDDDGMEDIFGDIFDEE